ncbi:MAG: helix-turn-helix domain-containing protein, partial [Bacteroidota bacterium]
KKLPDLVVSDIMMPGEPDGIGLCQSLKRDPLTCHIPVLMLTARSSQDAKMDAIEAGADSYLTKPFVVDELLATAQNLLENRRRLSERTKTALQVQWMDEPVAPVEDPFLEMVMEQIRKHLDDAGFGVEQMADALRISRQQLFKKVKSLTGMPPADLLRNLRLEKARRLLETGAANVSQAAYETGFDDPNYFSKAFKKHFGMSPSEAQKATLAETQKLSEILVPSEKAEG